MFLRSFGFAGRRSELQLQALDDAGNFRRTLAALPVTLQDGVQPLRVAFRTEPDVKLVQRLAVRLLEVGDRTERRLARKQAAGVGQHCRDRAHTRRAGGVRCRGGELLERTQVAIDLRVDPAL